MFLNTESGHLKEATQKNMKNWFSRNSEIPEIQFITLLNFAELVIIVNSP